MIHQLDKPPLCSDWMRTILKIVGGAILVVDLGVWSLTPFLLPDPNNVDQQNHVQTLNTVLGITGLVNMGIGLILIHDYAILKRRELLQQRLTVFGYEVLEQEARQQLLQQPVIETAIASAVRNVQQRLLPSATTAQQHQLQPKYVEPYIEPSIEKSFVSNIQTQTETTADDNTEYFKEFILNSNHILVSGATGDGKTTLISNILDLASAILPGAELLFLNPKPDPDTKFFFKGKQVKADYLNLKKPKGCKTPDCVEGLRQLDSILTDRMRLAQIAEENNQPMPKFAPLIMFVDEIARLLTVDKTLFCSVMERLSTLGRAYKLIFIGSGQGASMAQWGLKTRDQLQNFSRVYLKSNLNINMVFDNEVKFLPNRDNIIKTIDEFKSRAGGKKDPSSYYGLFIPQGNAEGSVCYLPRPNYFSECAKPKIHVDVDESTDVVQPANTDAQHFVAQPMLDAQLTLEQNQVLAILLQFYEQQQITELTLDDIQSSNVLNMSQFPWDETFPEQARDERTAYFISLSAIAARGYCSVARDGDVVKVQLNLGDKQ